MEAGVDVAGLGPKSPVLGAAAVVEAPAAGAEPAGVDEPPKFPKRPPLGVEFPNNPPEFTVTQRNRTSH